MRNFRRHRLAVSSLLGLALVTGVQPLHAQQQDEASVSAEEYAICYVKYVGNLVTEGIVRANLSYNECISRALATEN